MEKHSHSNSLRPCPSDWDIERPGFNMYGRRQSTGSSYARKGVLGHKPLTQNLSLGSVHEDEQDVVYQHDGNKMQRYTGPKFPSLHRRKPGSYLYRSMSEYHKSSTFSQSPSAASDDSQEDDVLIVTPFAQVLAKLHSVQSNFEHLLDIISEQGVSFTTPPKKISNIANGTNRSKEQPYIKDSMESLLDLDWCLSQLETLCSHQSVADMTMQKFRSLLTQEITKLSNSRSGNEISEFIMNTYTDSYKTDSSKFRTTLSPKESAPGLISSPTQETLLIPRALNKGSKPFTIDWKLSQVETILDKSVALPKYGVCTTKEDELGKHLKKINNWGLDIFLLYDLSNCFPLTAIAYKIFQRRNILQQFQIHPTTLINFFTSLEKSYLSVAYHNSKHAADVMQSSHVLLNLPTLKNLFSLHEITAALFAAAIHDVGHPGVTNQYLINTESELALLYNDNSVLENHHVSLAFKLLQNNHLDIFSKISKDQRKILRKTVIDIVLATDMTKHMTILANMQTMMETRNLTGSGKEAERVRILETMVHCADLSNPTKPLCQYKKWVELVFEEFFQQGDNEQEAGLVVSPNCDRSNVSVEESQVAFIDYIVRPIWETWSNFVYPDTKDILDLLEENYNYYLLNLKS